MTLDHLIIAFSAALFPCMLAGFAVSMRRDSRTPQLPMSATSSVLMLFSMLSSWVAFFVVRAWLLGYADRFLMHRASEHHLLLRAALIAAPCVLLLAFWIRSRWSDSRQAIPHTLGDWSGLLIPSALATFAVAIIVVAGSRARQFVTAPDRAEVQGVVLNAYQYKPHHGDRMRLAKIQLQDGSSLYATSRNTFFTNRLHMALLVNGTCPLDTLPIGLHVTATIRRSPDGVAVDSVRSAQPCRR